MSDKKQLHVPFLETSNVAIDISAVAAQLSEIEKNRLDYAPWQEKYPCKPEVQFAIAYGVNHLYLHYAVKEPVVQAAHGKTNSPVYRDSCVEFFVSFDNGDSYYNLEFNCLGTVLAAFGKDRYSREFLPEDVLSQIQCQAVIRKEQSARLVKWQLTVAIPFTTFLFHTLTSLQGQGCWANFYKCGDDLPEPHFLSWSNIQSSQPDFHLPQFFGRLLFE